MFDYAMLRFRFSRALPVFAAVLRMLTAILPLLVTGLAWAQQVFVHANDVAFTVRTDQKQFTIGETISLHYTITNVSNGPVTVPRSAWDPECSAGPHLWALLEDSAGKHYEGGWAGSCTGWEGFNTRIPSQKVDQVAALLKPGQSISGEYSFSTDGFAKELKPGAYRLEVVLYGWNSKYSEAEISDIFRRGAPLLSGEANATTTIQLIAPAH